MNKGSSFRSLQQLLSSVQTNLEMSGDHSVGAVGPILTPIHKLVHRTHKLQAGYRARSPTEHFFDIAQVSQNPTLAPDGKKVKFDQRLCGDAMVVHLKQEIPEITATR